MKDSMSLEKIAADIYTLVTGDTSRNLNNRYRLIVRRQRGDIPFQPTIESACPAS